MRTFLRGLAAVFSVAVKLATILAGVVAGVLSMGIGLSFVPDELLPYGSSAAVFILLAVLAGILWCANSIAVAPRVSGRAGKPWVRRSLRLLAVGQIGLGLLLAVVYGIDFFIHHRNWSLPRSHIALLDMAVASNAVGLMSLGGILWCVVRVAYPAAPAEPSAAPRPAS